MEAIEIQLYKTPAGRLLGAPPRPPISVDRWRKQCGVEIASAMAAGERVAGELLACVVQPQLNWPSAWGLTAELDRMGGGILTRWMRVRVLVSMGDLTAARGFTGGSLLGDEPSATDSGAPPASWEPRQLPMSYQASLAECVALTEERQGNLADALVAFELAAHLGGGCRVLYAGALAALELGNGAAFLGWQKLREAGSHGRADLWRGFFELRERRVLLGRPIEMAHLDRLYPLRFMGPLRFTGPQSSRGRDRRNG